MILLRSDAERWGGPIESTREHRGRLARSLPRRIVSGTSVLLLALVARTAAGQPPVTIEFDAPKEVAVGDVIRLVVRIANHSEEPVTIRDPVLDVASFEFQVRYENGRESNYTSFHPGAGVGSSLSGDSLSVGDEVEFVHEVPALKAGAWTFRALNNGVAQLGVLASPLRTVRVHPTEGRTDVGFRIATSHGEIRGRFWPEVAPATSLHVACLIRDGFYDGTPFLRTIAAFMIQGGSRGDAGKGYSIPAEFSPRPHVRGVFSMAREGDPLEAEGRPPRPRYRDSARTSFFLCVAAAPYLDERYTPFAEVIDGIEVADAIASAAVVENDDGELSTPKAPVVMTQVELVTLEAKEKP